VRRPPGQSGRDLRVRIDLSVEVRDAVRSDGTYVIDVTTSTSMWGSWLKLVRAAIPEIELRDVHPNGFSFTATLEDAPATFRRINEAAIRANAVLNR
jgi:hypothetical protein